MNTQASTGNYRSSTALEIHYRRNIVPDESLAFAHLLSREMMKVSMGDRTAIQEEIHGVRCLAVHETPELIRRGLDEFQRELDKIPKDEKRAYEECRVRAMLYQDEEDSCYALNEAFYLRFLRVDLFDAAKAARRFANYLEFVREHWGADIALQRLIRFSDFSKAEMKLFRKGYFQVLPFRDHAGRRVLTLLGGFDPKVDPIARAKALFYISDVLTRTDVESQQRGVVVITESYCWSSDDSGRDKRSKSILKFPNRQEGLYYTKRILESMPNRLIAMHNCWQDRPAFRIISKLLTIYGFTASKNRLRLKFHIGDELEMRYRLKAFGIPIELLPITETGSIKMINHNYWIKTRKHIEQGIDTDVNIIECPGSNDVVFRQGTSSMENPGTVKCRDLTLSLLENRDREMDNSNNGTRIVAKYQKDIVDQLVETIEFHRGGRFLEWDKHRSTWVQMLDRHKIKQKVSVFLHSIDKRYRRTPVANNGGRSITTSVGRIVSNSGIGIVSSNATVVSTSSESSHSSRSHLQQQQLSWQHSPSMFLQQNLDAMAIKSDDEDSGCLGPYGFLVEGKNIYKEQTCCRLGRDAFPSPEISRKRLKKI